MTAKEANNLTNHAIEHNRSRFDYFNTDILDQEIKLVNEKIKEAIEEKKFNCTPILYTIYVEKVRNHFKDKGYKSSINLTDSIPYYLWYYTGHFSSLIGRSCWVKFSWKDCE
jgi:hypothetical protein